jgi:hypothetical protein
MRRASGDWVVVERRSDQGGKRERTIKQVELRGRQGAALPPLHEPALERTRRAGEAASRDAEIRPRSRSSAW